MCAVFATNLQWVNSFPADEANRQPIIGEAVSEALMTRKSWQACHEIVGLVLRGDGDTSFDQAALHGERLIEHSAIWRGGARVADAGQQRGKKGGGKEKWLRISSEPFVLKKMVRLAGIEPTTPWFVAKYSIQLSYSRPKT